VLRTIRPRLSRAQDVHFADDRALGFAVRDFDADVRLEFLLARASAAGAKRARASRARMSLCMGCAIGDDSKLRDGMLSFPDGNAQSGGI
jgi:hypothetical protein